MSGHRHDSRRYSSSRRDSSPSRSRRESRRSSPGPSRVRSPPTRSDRSLPEQFGRIQEKPEDDGSTVLQSMKRSFTYNPLGCLTKCIGGTVQLRVWTRNYKEIRGICTGYVVAFDKHWNMVLRDVKEVYLKPRIAKTPYLNDMKSAENFLELPPRVEKPKKTAAKVEEVPTSNVEVPTPTSEVEVPTPTSDVEVPPPITKDTAEGEKKKKKRRKKKTSVATNRFMKQCFIRGDNIVMVALDLEPRPPEEKN